MFVVGETKWAKLVHVFVLIGLFEFVGERKQEESESIEYLR